MQNLKNKYDKKGRPTYEHKPSLNLHVFYKYNDNSFVKSTYAPNFIDDKISFYEQVELYSDTQKRKKSVLISKNYIEICIFDNEENIIHFSRYNIENETLLERKFFYCQETKRQDSYNDNIMSLCNAAKNSLYEVEESKKYGKQLFFSISDNNIKLWKNKVRNLK